VLVVHPAAAHVLVAHLTGRATKVSVWQDNLRHMYEAGRSAQTLARWHGVTHTTMRRWLKDAGTKLRKRGEWRTIEKKERNA